MGKQAPPPEDRAEKAVAELREVIREAHGLLKDLRAASATARRILDLQERIIEGDVADKVENHVSAEIVKGLDRWNNSLKKVIAESEERTIKRFDTLAASLLGEQPGDRSFEEIVQAFMDRQHFLEAQVAQAAHQGRIQIAPEPRFPQGAITGPPLEGLRFPRKKEA